MLKKLILNSLPNMFSIKKEQLENFKLLILLRLDKPPLFHLCWLKEMLLALNKITNSSNHCSLKVGNLILPKKWNLMNYQIYNILSKKELLDFLINLSINMKDLYLPLLVPKVLLMLSWNLKSLFNLYFLLLYKLMFMMLNLKLMVTLEPQDLLPNTKKFIIIMMTLVYAPMKLEEKSVMLSLKLKKIKKLLMQLPLKLLLELLVVVMMDQWLLTL